MTNSRDVVLKLQEIEATLQDHENSTSELKDVVSELMSIVQSLDKDVALQAEKQSHLIFRIEQLQHEIRTLDGKSEKGRDKQHALIENALMVVLGGLITYVLGLATGHK